MKAWNVSNGECVFTLDAGGPADSLLLSNGYLFVGMQKLEEGIIKVRGSPRSCFLSLQGLNELSMESRTREMQQMGVIASSAM